MVDSPEFYLFFGVRDFRFTQQRFRSLHQNRFSYFTLLNSANHLYAVSQI